MKKILIMIATSLFLFCCAGKSQIAPSYTFKLSKKSGVTSTVAETPMIKLTRHPTSAIEVKEGSVIRLSLDCAYLTELDEKSATSKGQVGNRELMLYAMIYKNGQFLRYSKITDLAEHMATYQPVVVQNQIFFTETIDTNYHIILKGYEVDTKALVKALRRVRSTDITSIEKSSFSPGDTFLAGFKDIVFGVFDVVLSVTGKSLDDWAANLNATKVFEHSIYVTSRMKDDETDKLLILGSGKVDYFVNKNATTDADINQYVRENITMLEAKTFLSKDLIDGTDNILSKAPYLILTAERLTNQTKQEN
ncbi:hypothetical protein [uncultured Desulfobacter sp.]|uniref:hypothetical protein n=1 Tax=uncultured Desulfobacter sp. TaxID=240139 RepID=UPI002AAB9A71|nr:hypothetical protein [uncultured Desulfobacter sp.]